jgi:hypothetical protein
MQYKWKIIGKVYIEQNLITSEVKFINRKRRRRKLNIMANLIDAGIKFLTNFDFHQIISKMNLFPLIKLHKLMHKNN